MLFSSFVFIFIFFPFTIALYFLGKNRTYRNVVLFLTSLFFYAWGEPKYVILMLFSIFINYILALLIDKNRRRGKLILVLSVVVNLLLIGVFKYLDFTILTANDIFEFNIPLANIALPIGISFYTFQIMSYVIDVYRGDVKAQKNIIYLGTYIALFPQLIAGPIVRYETIEAELTNRKETFDDFIDGLKRFMIGFSKKVLIANQMAVIADNIYNYENIATISTPILWLAALAYTFQIYYDFSGYSDMAIGMGRMFGFHFLENFNYPYIAKSITDFWRRWHISLSSWFKDYLYIPLGGNRVSKLKWIRNVFVVWFLTGLWHGASWNYVIWGLYFAAFLIVEKTILSQLLRKTPKLICWIYTFFIVIISWVIFRNENLSNLLIVIKNMFVYNANDGTFILANNFNIITALPYFIFAIIGSFPFVKNTANKFVNYNWICEGVGYMVVLLIFFLSICFLLTNSYNPFIYFRF